MTVEWALTFDCAGERLVGIVSQPRGACTVGLLVVVGGPQYRAGSHRQFVLLGRQLAQQGIAVMRFDCRGMGDSTGPMQSFEQSSADIAAAIGAFIAACPSLERIVLWGLCDAASACLLYWQATNDQRMAGMVLLNPWVRSEATFAKTQLKHYYLKRLLAPDFWRKLARGEVQLTRALRYAAKTVLTAATAPAGCSPAGEPRFDAHMAVAMQRFPGPMLLVLSSRDLTAQEFLANASADARWRGVMARPNVELREVRGADHTFSTAAWRLDVARLTLDWLRSSFHLPQPASAALED